MNRVPNPAAANLRILIVDDNESIHGDFRKILLPDAAEAAFDQEENEFFGAAAERMPTRNFDLTFAFQGREALDIVTAGAAAGRRFAMVFMDVRMPPGWDGLETARHLWEVDADLQMVICTAYSDKSWEEMAMELGHPERVLILKKPFDAIEVQQLAHALTEKWALVQAARANTRFLEETVAARTRELTETVSLLAAETCRVREQALLIEKARDAILVWDLDGAIRFWNRGAEALYGWPAAEAIGRNVFELLENDDPEPGAVFRTGDWQGELTQRNREGEEIVAECRWTLVRDEAGQPATVLGIHCDITEKKQLEAKFLRVQRLDTIGTLAGGIAHDLNNILHPIALAMDMLRESLTDPADREMLDLVTTNSQRASGLVRQVLSFARGVEGERCALQPEAIAREVAQIVRETFPRDIAFRFSHPPEIPAVRGDATQLHQVLLNLCVNARDAMPDGGELHFSIGETEVSHHQAAAQPGARAGRHVRFSVSDTGAGIPAKLHEKIFVPFFTTKGTGSGTGLGLATSLGIVRSHGGFITLGSGQSGGATFHVFIPASKAAEPAAPLCRVPPRPAAAGATGATILIVDDEPAILQLVRITLEAHGYDVLTATDGAAGARIFAENAADIHAVITDMMMPVMDGREMIAKLLETDPAVRIVATTGMASDRDAAEIRRLGVARVVFKPFSADELLRAIHELEPALLHAC